MTPPKLTATLAAFVATLVAGCFGGPVAVGDQAPTVRLTDVDGNAVRIPPGDGRISLLHLFNPLRTEATNASFAHLLQVQGNLSSEPIAWLSVATFRGRSPDADQRLAEASAARDAHGVPWAVAPDTPSRDADGPYGRSRAAMAYVIDGDGTVRVAANAFQGSCLEDSLRALLHNPDQPIQVSLC